MLRKAFDENPAHKRAVYKQYKRFQVSHELIKNNNRVRRRNTLTTVEKVKEVYEQINTNLRITIREIAEEVGISFMRSNFH